ncbi:hypothetical protein KBX37_30350 [Micromonospora sp. U56]|uniref:hypothetical protein n=1 Tax=Micromonospora sp. U56 TaxID=2824900 RepID=UPI001B363C29|nr:hypothetical protein [Micromonospora sp. U56]MBQ0897317.1 hypothetical protein [Micromonospora sp. U56]
MAAWDGAGTLTDLEPKVAASGKRDFRALAALLEQPVRAGCRSPNNFVWHASMRLAPEERRRDRVSDTIWESMAVQMLAGVGVATTATDPGLRWIAMRNADDHVHIVATLVREDGRTNWLRNDYPLCVKATYNVARRYNLHRRVPPADRTAHRRPHPVEVSKARRTGRAQTSRDDLRRRVRTAWPPDPRRSSSPGYARQGCWSDSDAAAPILATSPGTRWRFPAHALPAGSRCTSAGAGWRPTRPAGQGWYWLRVRGSHWGCWSRR